MTTDTSAEALERMADWLFGTLGTNAVQDTLRALAAEKRRAREGVTDEILETAVNAFDDVYTAEIELGSSFMKDNKSVAMRTALEAVWPDGRDAKDAARYRWLRSCGAAAEELAICTDYGWVTGSDFDETIDAAMAQESGR